MTWFVIRGLMSRKLRTGLTAIAIVLGVAMISGTFVLTDSIEQAFGKIFTDVRQGSDAVISGKSAFDTSQSDASLTPTFDESLLPKVRALSEVAQAEGSVSSESTHLIGNDGKVIQFGLGGSPNLGFSIASGTSPFNPFTLVTGTWPGPGEVVIDNETASKKHLEAGQDIDVQVEGPVQTFRVSGIMQFSSGLTIGGATLAGFDLPTAQALFEKRGRLDEIAVAAKPNVTSTQLVKAIRPILPSDARVRTSAQQVESDAADTNSFISFLRGFLLAFGGIALFVGSFVIANSLSITIAQRTRELATLRTLGASRRQVLRSIIIEALVVGVVASVIGLFLGLLLAKGLFKLFDLVGFILPNTGLVFLTRTSVIAGLLAGTLVTLIASLRPAIRATRVPPIAAVREGAILPPGKHRRLRGVGAALMAVAGIAAIGYGIFANGLGTKQVLIWMGARDAPDVHRRRALLVATRPSARSDPRLARDPDRRCGRPARARQCPAKSAANRVDRRRADDRAHAGDARRDPRVGTHRVVQQVGGRPVRGRLRDHSAEQLFAHPHDGCNGSGEGARRHRDRECPHRRGARLRERRGRDRGRPRDGAGDRDDLEGRIAGGLLATRKRWRLRRRRLRQGQQPDDGLARRDHVPEWEHADLRRERRVRSASGRLSLRHRHDLSGGLGSEVPSPENLFSFVKMTGGTSETNQAALDDALKEFPNAKAQTRESFISSQIRPFKQILNILYILLALSVLISLFGIVNTLVLTVFERTREIGMLRAVGMTRRQVRRMIRHESIITALIGAMLGIVLGVALAALIIVKVDFLVFSFPTTQVIVFVVAAIIVGIIAAIFPARRAAGLDPLEAIAYE